MTLNKNYPCGEQILMNGNICRIGELISQGTDGRIYAANFDGADSVVVKYFECTYGDALWKGAMREIEATQKLQKCPYTVSVLGCCAIRSRALDAQVFIMMERLKCCDEMILDVNDVLRMGADICLALEFIRKKGLVHNDVKPANIFLKDTMIKGSAVDSTARKSVTERDLNRLNQRFLNSSGVWQLGDFGCIQPAGMCVRQGSPAYRSPEAHMGKKCDIRSDIYSLGITMYKLLSGGKFPFCDEPARLLSEDEVNIAIKRRMHGERISPIDGVSAEINKILLRMCEFEPNKRYSSPAVISKKLKKYIKS